MTWFGAGELGMVVSQTRLMCLSGYPEFLRNDMVFDRPVLDSQFLLIQMTANSFYKYSLLLLLNVQRY